MDQTVTVVIYSTSCREVECRRCPTLPHPGECSTIGAVGLSFRVRDGTGCFPFAMAAVTLATHPPPSPALVGDGWGVGEEEGEFDEGRLIGKEGSRA